MGTPITEERKRLAILRSYPLEMVATDQALNAIIQAAAEKFQAPIAAISLLESNYQWFKATLGLSRNPIPLSEGFCRFAIRQKPIFTVEDATRDERFNHLQLVVNEPRVRAYAGVALMSIEGHPLGTLCVLDTQPRLFSEDQKNTLLNLSKQVVSQFEIYRTIQNAVLARAEESDIRKIPRAVANELLNPLTVIKLKARKISNLARQGPIPSSQLISEMYSFENWVDHIAETLKSLSMGTEADVRTTSRSLRLSELLDATLERVHKELKFLGIKFTRNSLPLGLLVYGDPQQLSDALLNLFRNSFEALEDQRNKEIRVVAEDAGDRTQIRYSNSGPSIPTEHHSKVFQPFFTTKKSRAMGLGLSLSRKIIEAHRGRIELDAADGKTTFVIDLPKSAPVVGDSSNS